MGRELSGARYLLAVLAAFLILTPAAVDAAGPSTNSSAAAPSAVTTTTSTAATSSPAALAASTTAAASAPTTAATSTSATVAATTVATTTAVPARVSAATARARYLAARAKYLAARRTSRADTIVRIAKRYLRHPYALGATGPRRFDCIGLVRYVYRKAGLAGLVGPWQSVQGTLRYFRSRHLASTRHPQVGDLVVWGHGSHIGIYIGRGKAISALVRGVRVHGVFALTTRFTTYLHVDL